MINVNADSRSPTCHQILPILCPSNFTCTIWKNYRCDLTASQKFWMDIDILSKLKGYRQKLTILPPGWGYLLGQTENRRIKPNRLGLILSNYLNSTIPFRLGLMKIKTELPIKSTRKQTKPQNSKNTTYSWPLSY